MESTDRRQDSIQSELKYGSSGQTTPGLTTRSQSLTASDRGKDCPTSTSQDASGVQYSEKGESDERIKTSWIAGGKWLPELRQDDLAPALHGSLTSLDDVDIPLTATDTREEDGKTFIVLQFRDGDPENPFEWSKGRKLFATSLLCLMTLFIGLATTAYSSGIGSMVEELNTSTELGQMGLFCFNFACACAPLFLAPFCELVGRQIIYGGAYLCFSIIFIGLALGQNIATILVMRTLLGLSGCVGTILVGGTFSDIYSSRERSSSMALFSYIAILGTVAAPIYAGFIDETIGWRWIEGIQGLSNIPLLVVVLLCFPETRGGVYLKRRAHAIREATGDERYVSPMELEASSVKDMLHQSSIKAIHMLVTEPVVFAFALWIGFAWFVTFLFLSVIPITFQDMRGWSEGVAGLPYISLVVGVSLGYATHQFQMRKYEAIASDPNRKVLPEDRLYGAMYGAIWLPVGLFIYSFTQYGFLPWIAPTIALAPIAVGIYFIFESTYSYTGDCYGESASSAIAGQGFVRNTLGAVSPLFATQFFQNVGSQYAGLILSIVALALSMIPFVMYKYGHVLRARSKLALTF